MTLEKELQTFHDLLPDLLEHNRGQFALIKGDRLVGTYTTPAEAFDAGVREFGNTSFLIRQISEQVAAPDAPALAVGMINAGP